MLFHNGKTQSVFVIRWISLHIQKVYRQNTHQKAPQIKLKGNDIQIITDKDKKISIKSLWQLPLSVNQIA